MTTMHKPVKHHVVRTDITAYFECGLCGGDWAIVLWKQVRKVSCPHCAARAEIVQKSIDRSQESIQDEHILLAS